LEESYSRRRADRSYSPSTVRRGDTVITENIPTYPDLAGKGAVVTGGSGEIGAAACRLLVANGAEVAVNGRGETQIEAVVVGEIRSDGGRAIGVVADVTDLAAVNLAIIDL
jgi:NADP-dependent 3-hydroxy acid dehydrogenase YdfG